MSASIQNPAKCEVRSVVWFLNEKCGRPAEIHKHVVAVYGKVMNRQNVTKWCREFSEGKSDVHDEQRNGRISLISDDFLQEIKGEIRANRHMTIRELHHIIPEVSKTKVHEALTEKLGYRKLWARWVPKMITDDQQTKGMGSALNFLTRFDKEIKEFLDSIVTGDETWGFHHTHESSTTMMRCKKTQWRDYKGRRQTSMTLGYRSWFQDLINVWTMPATTMLINKDIHSVAFVN
jgi:histone-lysine N-methyltransferase SETMAR